MSNSKSPINGNSFERCNIYLDIDGVLLANDLTPANHVKEFLTTVLQRYPSTTYWLTTHCQGDASVPIQHIGHLFDDETVELMKRIKPTSWETAKTRGIDFSQPFLWFDDDLFYEEKQTLAGHGASENWIRVDLKKDPDQLAKFIASFPLPSSIAVEKSNVIFNAQISQPLLTQFQPKEEWLAHKSEIHGVGHLARVFILQEMICDQLEKENVIVNRDAVRWAAISHDVGRYDDGLDPEHGQRSAQWIRQNLRSVLKPEQMDIATYIVHWHVPSDSHAPVMTTELKVLKDADALDRVRLGDLDPNYLRTDVAKSMIPLAEQLYEISQYYGDVENSEPFEAVVKAAQKLRIIES